ncbi:MAG: DUF4405 domain-containing protein [Desulfobacterales bacterium]|jgi:hypothetical protein
MNIRQIASLTALLSLVLLTMTVVVLYIVPQGRVAYWADWRFWGLTKTDWGNIHINMGLLFLIALIVHLYYNWKPLINYLKDKAKKIKVFTPEFNAALVITIVFVVGTYLMLPPFSWVMSLNDHFKDSGAEKYGEPPYGHAELSSLKTFAKKLKLDLTKSMKLLDQAGYPVEDSMITLQTIGKRYNIPPQQIYETIKPALIVSEKDSANKIALPESPPPGTGNLTLADFCIQFELSTKLVIRELKGKGITASADLTLKQIASENQTSPIDLYEIIKNIAQS